MVILDISKPISLILKNKKSKNPKFVNYRFIIHKNGNKTSMQPILKSNYTPFMFNNIFCEMRGKKVIHWGGLVGMGEPSKFCLGSVISLFTSLPRLHFHYLYPSILLGYPSNNHTFMPSIGSF